MSDSDKAAMYFGRGSNSKAAHDLMKSNPAEYKRLKEVSLADGRLARDEHLNPNYRDKFNPKQFSPEELKILGEIPESETNKYYRSPSNGGSDTLGNLAADPKRQDYYSKVRAAAVLRGLVPATQRVTAPEPRPTNSFFTLSDELCAKAGLPKGYQCDQRGFEQVVLAIGEIAERKREAEIAVAKVAAQAAKDAAIDASLSTVGHIRETPEQKTTQK